MSILPDVPNSRIAIYAGSFDPITRGHEDLMHRSLEYVDRLIVAVAANSTKQPLFTIDERQNPDDGSSRRAYGVNCSKRGTASRQDILDHSHAITFLERSFEQLPCSVSLGLLPHGECSQWMIVLCAGVADRIRDRVRAQR